MGTFLTIDATGISGLSYPEVLAWFQTQYRLIYGSNIYIEPDSQDGQLIGIQAQAVKDVIDAAIAVYNDFSPATAQGAGLSSVVKVNGITRRVATRSTVTVQIVGQAGTIIEGGVVGDGENLGTRWTLPPTVTIPNIGEIFVTATAVDRGAVRAELINQVLTPQPGWQTVINSEQVVPGDPVETDAALRRRQSRSTALAATTPVESIEAALLALLGVGRVKVYENVLGVADANGIPGHSIAAVVEGGNTADIVAVIARKKTPGAGAFGRIYSQYVDARGIPSRIGYSPLDRPGVQVQITIKAFLGYVSTTGDALRQAVVDEINGLDIGEAVYIDDLFVAAKLYGDPLGHTYKLISIAVSLVPFSFDLPGYGFDEGSWFTGLTESDLILNYDQAASCILENVILTVVT